MDTEHYVGLALVAVLAALMGVGWVLERRAWNHGTCSRCGGRWLHFDVDSQGGRGYKCKGGHIVWISYPWIET